VWEKDGGGGWEQPGSGNGGRDLTIPIFPALAVSHRREANRGGAGAGKSRWSVYPCSAVLVVSELVRLVFLGCAVALFIGRPKPSR
jgi:hypothetical protein